MVTTNIDVTIGDRKNGLHILQSIDQRPFELGITRDTLGNTSEEGGILGPERPRTYDDLDDNEQKRYDVDVHATNIVLQGLPKDIYKLINHNIKAKAIWDNVKMLLAGNWCGMFLGMQNRAGNANAGQGKPIKCYNCNRIGHIARNYTQPNRPQNSDYLKDKMLLMQAQENGAVLDEEKLLFLVGEQGNTFDADVDNQPVQDLALNADNIFQADECDAFDSDVNDVPTAQNYIKANLSSTVSSKSTMLNEHEIHNEVQQSNVIDSTSVHMGAQNPFYLKKAKVAQPTLYDGNELINLDHDPIDVPSSEEDLELAELTRQKMHEKLNDPVIDISASRFNDLSTAYNAAMNRVVILNLRTPAYLERLNMMIMIP
ncbi:retrovirus-related pol polyprotein from transposon TNT 1-94 [Tanacetum coccineum]